MKEKNKAEKETKVIQKPKKYSELKKVKKETGT